MRTPRRWTRTRRDLWLFWTNADALRRSHRMGPNRLRRLQRQDAHLLRFVKSNVSNSDYRGMF